MRLPASLARRALSLAVAAMPAVLLPPLGLASDKTYTQQPALAGKGYGKEAMTYSDFNKATNGLLYKDGKLGSGSSPQIGDRVVVDWTGYTIGYFGRPFETKKLKELDAKDDEFLRFEVGRGEKHGVSKQPCRASYACSSVVYRRCHTRSRARDHGNDRRGSAPTCCATRTGVPCRRS